MKKSNVLFVLGCFIFICFGCTHDEEITPLEKSSKETVFDKEEKASEDCKTTPIKNELVVKYKREALHKRRKIRARHGVKDVKRCECADKTLELWVFDTNDAQGNPIDIEEKKEVAETDPDLEGVNNNFILGTTGTAGHYSSGTPFSNVFATHLIAGSQDGFGIAVLDTGLQFDYLGFNQLFLYNSLANSTACNDGEEIEISGWDFRDQDHIANDENGHGTIVTKIISQTLEDLNVDYRILPVKIFDKDGKGSYFDLLCGYRFAVKKPGIDIINMSFGWCGEPYSLLQKFITETENNGEILIVSSAGNNASNNDSTPHYPSSYPNTNVLSITAMNSRLTYLASFSNYGRHSVDFAATGEKILFNFNEGPQRVSGTSFSTAFGSANAAWFYSQGIVMKNIETNMKAASINLISLEKIKHKAYILD